MAYYRIIVLDADGATIVDAEDVEGLSVAKRACKEYFAEYPDADYIQLLNDDGDVIYDANRKAQQTLVKP